MEKALHIDLIVNQIISNAHWAIDDCHLCRTKLGLEEPISSTGRSGHLFKCIMVSKLWAAVAIPKLWAHQVGIQIFEQLVCSVPDPISRCESSFEPGRESYNEVLINSEVIPKFLVPSLYLKPN